MSWVDKKYKNQLGKQKFPKGMKEQGWESMQSLLDSKMPVSTPKGGAASSPWYWAGAAAVVATLVGLPFFFMNQPDQAKDSSPTEIPVNSVEQRIADEFSQEATGSNTIEITAQDIASGSVVSQSESANPNTENQEVLNPREELLATETIVASAAQKPLVDDGEKETTSERLEVEESREQNVLSEELVVAESEEVEEIQSEEIIPIQQSPVFTVNEALAENEVVGSVENDVMSSVGEEAVVQNELTSETQESSSDVIAATDEGASEEVISVDDQDEELVVATQNPAEEETVSEVDENTTAELSSKDDLEDNLSSSAKTVKSAHLAFLDADDEAPIPDLMTFSKERFALSVWGGYLFTGKVLGGDNQKYIDQITSSEKSTYSVPTGVGLDYFIDGNWTVGTGVGWAEYGEDVDYTVFNVTSSFDSLSIDGRYDSPSNYPNIVSIDSVRVIDTVNQGHWNYNVVYRNDDSTASKYKGRNTFRYIEVPFTVGYRFGKGRIKPWLKAGVILGLPVEASYAYPQYEAASFAEVSGKGKLASVQYSGLFQAGIDFYLTRALSLRLNALGTYQINPMLTYEGVSQRYYRVGGTLGLAYNF